MSLSEFLAAALVPRDASHASGTLERAEAILRAEPAVGTMSIHAAAVLGDDATVRQFLQEQRSLANAASPPYQWDPLTCLCFSRYLRLEPARSASFVRTAQALLDAGADPHGGWVCEAPGEKPVWESLLYGAAGIAHDPDLTRLLLQRGADPNDDETPYHTPESYDNRAMEVLVRSGRLTADSLATMLLRKTDVHDGAGIEWLLAHGADPNRMTQWGRTTLQHSVLRDNQPEIIGFLLAAGADPTLVGTGVPHSSVVLAARRGRGDLLLRFAQLGVALPTAGIEAVLTACALNDPAQLRLITGREPALLAALRADGGKPLAEFAGVGNTEGVRQLLDLGVPADARFAEGDGYWDVAPGSTALHVAAWRGRHETVRLLLARGAPVNATDGRGRTALVLAVRACVDSYWVDRRSPDSVHALLAAGAPAGSISTPTGYDVIDLLLQNRPA